MGVGKLLKEAGWGAGGGGEGTWGEDCYVIKVETDSGTTAAVSLFSQHIDVQQEAQMYCFEAFQPLLLFRAKTIDCVSEEVIVLYYGSSVRTVSEQNGEGNSLGGEEAWYTVGW